MYSAINKKYQNIEIIQAILFRAICIFLLNHYKCGNKLQMKKIN